MLFRLNPRKILPFAVIGFVVLVALMMRPAAAQAPNPDVGYGVPPGTPGSPISFSLPPSSYIAPGHVLFEQNCSSCHGTAAAGSAIAPDLQGLGAGTVDFWLSTGRMPLANASESAVEKPSRFTNTEILQIVAYVNSLLAPTPGNIQIPSVDLSNADLTNGYSLFVLNCAGCHTITGSGDAAVRATEELDASVTGSGDVHYSGNPPQVRKNVTGSGDISPR